MMNLRKKSIFNKKNKNNELKSNHDYETKISQRKVDTKKKRE